MSQHWILLWRLGQFIKQASYVATLFIYRNQRFFFLQRNDTHHLVATYISSFYVATYITLSLQRPFFEALLLSQHAFPCCNLQCRDRKSLFAKEVMLSICFICHDRSFFVSTDFLDSSHFLSLISAQKVLFRTLFLIGFHRFLCTNCYN